MAELGGLLCQRDSYLKQCSSIVLTCEPVNDKSQKKKDSRPLFHVVLNDTVLFPEGGGQPYDIGKIADLEVIDVQRKNNQCVHTVTGELEIGKEVNVHIDWNRRFDHMQQHSGQHLLSAIAIREFGMKTLSWNLGESICHVELEAQKMSQEQIEQLEIKVNEEIRASKPVKMSIDSSETKRTTIPQDHVGPIRTIEIEGIDSCTCCGTHVSNTSELQMIKLLHTEKMRGNTRLFFVVGNRVLKLSQKMFENERKLTQLLNTSPSEHAESVDKLQKQVQTVRKSLKSTTEELCEMLSDKLIKEYPNAIIYHKDDAELEFLSLLSTILTNKIGEGKRVLFLSCGDLKKGEGVFLLNGPTEKIDKIGPQIAKLLDAKGGGKKGRFQAKANALTQSGLAQVETLLQSDSL